jgi:hypothetical protein
VAELARFGGGAVGGDGQLAQGRAVFGGEGEHISRAIDAAELAIQAAQLPVVGDEAVKLAASGDSGAKSARELL